MKTLRQVAWKDDVESTLYPRLVGETKGDVAIIGGGITGVATAYLLAKSGKKAVLLEKKQLGEYATKHTTACITEIIDTDLSDLVKTYGRDAAKLIIRSHREAIDHIERNVMSEKLDCEFMRCSDFLFAADKDQKKDLDSEYEAGKKLGIDMVKKDDEELGFKNHGYIEVRDQAKFHPLKYIDQLAKKAVALGAEIYEHSEVTDINQEAMTFKTEHGSVKADWIISAAYEPFKQPAGLFLKKGMYESYVFDLEIEPDKIPEGIYEDFNNPYYYLRVDRKGAHDRMIIGGEDHRKDIPVDDDKNFDALEAYVKRTFPGLKYKIVHKWDGPVLEPTDGLAYIGCHKNPHVLYAFGFSGNGMTYSHIAAEIFADAVAGKKNEFAEIYRADRLLSLMPLMTKGRDYAEELYRGALKNTFRAKEK